VSFLSLAIPTVIAGLAWMLIYLSIPIGVCGTILALVVRNRLTIQLRPDGRRVSGQGTTGA